MGKVMMIFLTVVFFTMYFLLVRYMYNAFVPFNTATSLIGILIIILIVLPAAYLSATKTYDIIKSH